MSFEIPQSARQAAQFAVLALSLGLLSGCQGLISALSSSQVRIVDVSPDAPNLDIYQSHDVLAYSLGFGTITSYVPVTPGTYTIAANSTGTAQVISSAKNTFLPSTQYTVLIGDTAAGPQSLTLKDQSQPAPAGQIALRFIGQAPRSGAVDIYLLPSGQTLADVRPIAANVSLGSNTGYLNAPAGTYTLVMLPAGSPSIGTTPAAYAGTQVSYADGSARTMILIDQRQINGYHLQIITADDYDPPSAS
ncbi:DUF4397 domain-containing protein [Edaphobacter dinghuensis]|uniref:DUF4397 domain-containing protein n=1 Tax=Edaphobacter dinghuensis TaxID=1560005 RepID=A0A917HH75_9BACT|nr:DUF4397 domain-containing protein [Edaphobacter dinghuensis]GGG78407.1 hypothetical protein GCM10011585_21970 [Edaphobacter dinghuensis]